MPDVRHLSFGATLGAVPIWLGVLMSTASEVNEAGVVVYGVLLLFLAPAGAYLTSRHLGPYALRSSWPWGSPQTGLVVVTLSGLAVAAAWHWYSLYLSQGEATAFGALSWYLTLMLGPPVFFGCLVHLLAHGLTRHRSAG